MWPLFLLDIFSQSDTQYQQDLGALFDVFDADARIFPPMVLKILAAGGRTIQLAHFLCLFVFFEIIREKTDLLCNLGPIDSNIWPLLLDARLFIEVLVTIPTLV